MALHNARPGLTVALTGGPGGGKSTAAVALKKRLGSAVVVVPEVATHLLGGLFPPLVDLEDRRRVQRAIYNVQVSLEEMHRARLASGQGLLFDRGLVDGAAYWPDGPDAFFAHFGDGLASVRARYDAVVFMESAAVGGLSIGSDNSARVEARQEASDLDARLRHLWSPHPHFHHVPHTSRFEEKVEHAVGLLERLVTAGRAS